MFLSLNVAWGFAYALPSPVFFGWANPVARGVLEFSETFGEICGPVAPPSHANSQAETMQQVTQDMPSQRKVRKGVDVCSAPAPRGTVSIRRSSAFPKEESPFPGH